MCFLGDYEKVRVSTEIRRCVSLPGDRGRFVMTTPNAVIRHLLLLYCTACRITSRRAYVSHSTVWADRYAGRLHSEGTSVLEGLLVDKYIRTRSSRSRSASVRETRHAIVRSSMTLLHVTPLCKCLPICVTPFYPRNKSMLLYY